MTVLHLAKGVLLCTILMVLWNIGAGIYNIFMSKKEVWITDNSVAML